MDATRSGRLLPIVSVVILLGAIFLYSSTGSQVFLGIPFLVLYVFLLVRSWKAAYWVMLCTIPLSMELTLGNGLSSSLPDEPLMWLFLLCLLGGWAHNPGILRKWWWQHPVTLIIALQLLWLIVTVCTSKVPGLSLKFLLAKTWFLGCFFVLPALIFTVKADFKKAFLLLFLPVLATMVIITVRHAMLGFGFVSVGDAIGVLYDNHVEYSSVVSMLLPLVWVAWRLIPRERLGMRRLMACVMLFFIIVVLLTYARAAVLGLLFAGGVVYAIQRKRARLIMPVCYSVIILGLSYLIPNERFMILKPDFEQTYMHDNYSDHMSATFQGRDLSSMERLYRWIAAIRMSRDRPLTGFGPHAFYYNYQSYALQEFRTYTSDNPERSTTHNYFLLMLSEQGWPAMLLYALLMAVLLSQAQAIYHRFKDRFYKTVTLGIAALLAVNFVNNFFSELIETHKVGALFYLAISLLIILDRKSRTEETTDLA